MRNREATEVKPPLHRKLGEKTKKDESLLERLVQILEAKKDKNDEGSSVGSIRLKMLENYPPFKQGKDDLQSWLQNFKRLIPEKR